jgi:hypothetical protein
MLFFSISLELRENCIFFLFFNNTICFSKILFSLYPETEATKRKRMLEEEERGL